MVGAKGGPTKSDIEEMDHWTEGSYICGGRIPDKKTSNFMFRGNCFAATMLRSNNKITCVGRKQRIEFAVD